MKKLNFKKLTPELEKTAKSFAKKQIDIYLSTVSTPETEKEAVENIKKFYKLAKLDFPKNIVWFSSPLDKDYLRTVDSAVDSAVYSAVDSAVDNAVYSAVDSAVYSAVDSAVDSAVYSAVDSAVYRAVGSAVYSAVYRAVYRAVGSAVGSLYWANRFSWFKFYSKYMKKNDMDSMGRFTELTNGATIIGDTLYIFRKEELICRDREGRLHSETGMAYKFRDGNGFYFYHGVQVTKKIIETPEKLTKKDWLNEENAEVRRVIQERMVDFPKKVGAKTINKDKWGTLVEVKLKNDPEKIARYIKVKDISTTRIYFLRVPPATKTAKEGVAWTFSLSEKDYKPIQEA